MHRSSHKVIGKQLGGLVSGTIRGLGWQGLALHFASNGQAWGPEGPTNATTQMQRQDPLGDQGPEGPPTSIKQCHQPLLLQGSCGDTSSLPAFEITMRER